ncbi:hypothetical protein ACA910_005416 [Epithemia clementina (nom. ined.)]
MQVPVRILRYLLILALVTVFLLQIHDANEHVLVTTQDYIPIQQEGVRKTEGHENKWALVDTSNIEFGISANKTVIAWLEKSGDVKSIDSKSIREVQDKVSLHPSCFEANIERGTLQLLERQQQGLLPRPLPTPIINVGLPKIGSSTLYEFFQCAGYKANHGQNGICFQKAHQAGKPVLESCDIAKLRNPEQQQSIQAWLQLDVTSPPKNCHYPQMSELEQIHQEAPNATLILNFRPMLDWYRSLRRWRRMHMRLQQCDLPGLPRGKGRELRDLQQWFGHHVQRIRQFVQRHPSHALIELNLYDTHQSSKIMAQLFQTNATCWGHVNANKNKTTDQTTFYSIERLQFTSLTRRKTSRKMENTNN